MTSVKTLSQESARHVSADHEWLMERLAELDSCLESILYFGEVCGDMRGFAGLRQRCEEVYQFLSRHIPEEEAAFERLREERREVSALLDTLISEHRGLLKELKSCLATLDTLESGALIPEDLFKLEDRLDKVVEGLKAHIRSENKLVLPLMTAGEPT